jgi:hypothetical protein
MEITIEAFLLLPREESVRQLYSSVFHSKGSQAAGIKSPYQPSSVNNSELDWGSAGRGLARRSLPLALTQIE